jgi:hypothetical protein
MTSLPRRVRAKSADVNTSKLAKLIRLLGSNRDGEVIAAARALQRTLEASGKDLHDLADAVTAGLRPPPPPRQRSLAPPEPDRTNWEAMAWYCHFHRFQLRSGERERVADYLLGQAFYDSDGRCTEWHLEELRRIVAHIRRETATVAPW